MPGGPIQDYSAFYEDIYAYIGFPLEPKHQMAAAEISEAELRLGIRAPRAHSAYYEVAGRRDEFNRCLDEMHYPDQWFIQSDRLVFYQGHPACVSYGIQLDRLSDDNPPVEMGNGARPTVWYDLSPTTTNFMQITTYWQGAYAGAMTNLEWAKVNPDLKLKLDADWEYLGECNDMFCYRRPRQVACFLQWGDEWRLYAAGNTPEEPVKIGKDLDVEWMPWNAKSDS